MLIPSVVGGLPIIYLHNMYIRAESDLLNPFIDLVKFLETHDFILHQILVKLCRHVDEHDPNIMGLLMDPYSINSGRPTLLESLLRSTIKP